MKPARPLLTKEERRAKREERREKQRADNVGRAAKMHAYRMRSEEEAGAARPASASKEQAASVPRINVGCSGWFYWHWKGGFYPEEMPTSAWFSHYMQHFRTVELNAPFYSWPTLAAVQGWVKQAGRGKFIYTVKVCELITHVRRFARTAELVRDFGCIADLLGPRMGCFLFQLPPSFHYSRDRLDRILRQLDPARRNVVEFRHRSWWREAVYDAFRAAGAIFCSCSGPRLPDELVTTADDIYLRFHGTRQWYRHDYAEEELAVWVERIQRSAARRLWVYFNNDRDGYAIKNARMLLRQLGEES